MKPYLYIIIIILLFSCKSSDKDTIILLDEAIERSNEYLEALSYNPSASIEYKYAVYPNKFQSVKDIADSINKKHREIHKAFEKIREKYSVIYEEEDRSFVFVNTAGNTEELFKKIADYKKYISKVVADSLIILSAPEYFDIEKYNNGNIKYAELNLLINKVNYFNPLVLYSLAESISLSKYYFTKYKPVVIPQNNILKPGDYYEADIFFVLFDITVEFKVIINNETYIPKNGIINYKKQADKVGTITENGFLILNEQSGITEIDIFPFEFEYKVINK